MTPKPQLTPYVNKGGGPLRPDEIPRYRFIVGQVGGHDWAVIVGGLTDWLVYDPNHLDSVIANGPASGDIDVDCRAADQAALQWYEIPDFVSSQSTSSTGRYQSSSSMKTHCSECGAKLIFDGINGMVCPVHRWDY